MIGLTISIPKRSFVGGHDDAVVDFRNGGDDRVECASGHLWLCRRPSSVVEKVNSGRFVDPGEYTFLNSVNFETAASKYARLNKIIGVGTGSRPPERPIYEIFEVL